MRHSNQTHCKEREIVGKPDQPLMFRSLSTIALLGFILLTGCKEESSIDKATRNGILIVGNNSEPQSFDPHIATSVADMHIINAVMEGLVRGDPKDDSIVHPGVALSWESSEQADEWTFHLRKDVVWSDGTPITSQDFAYAYQRLLHPKFGGRYSDMLYPLLNAEQFNKDKQAAFPWEQVGVSCPDSHTLVLKLRASMPQLPLLLLHPTWFPIPRHALEAHQGMLDRTGGWTRPGKAVGNGPFVMSEHRFNDYVEVAKNPLFHGAKSVALNAIRFLPTVNGFTETRMYFDGKIHVTNNVPPEMSDYAKRHAGDAYKQENYYTTIFYRLNTLKPPLNDPRVRQALTLSIDRETLVRDVARGAGTPAYGFTPPGAGYETPQQLKFDPQRARRLLAKAGYPGGKGFPKVEIMTTSREVQKTMAEAIQAMWKQHLGIHIDIRSCEWTAYKFAQNTMQYDISSSSWSGDYLDPSTFIDLWASQSGNNNTGWASARFDAEIEKARHSGNVGNRMASLASAETAMLEESPVIPLYWAKRCYLQRPEVKGWHPLLLDNHIPEAIRLKKEANHD